MKNDKHSGGDLECYRPITAKQRVKDFGQDPNRAFENCCKDQRRLVLGKAVKFNVYHTHVKFGLVQGIQLVRPSIPGSYSAHRRIPTRLLNELTCCLILHISMLVFLGRALTEEPLWERSVRAVSLEISRITSTSIVRQCMLVLGPVNFNGINGGICIRSALSAVRLVGGRDVLFLVLRFLLLGDLIFLNDVRCKVGSVEM